ncbi:hypothetical protein EOA60_05885 [Mesorhizobium sp. M1A.F.Ca.IN.020.06.1.1]|jgi:hypothetical protein|uniref:multiubiquitin domain-containing protein n=1 Tax=unclassified Mesorhizobium TaxID=325217 RepID=UPI000FCC399D|nr:MULTISPECIES: multiubiquitin domain-containing protein [unclassified Mesorhizobium]RUV81542.1 hypothetical protein EOA51_31005 [Mesorhizobium sp. M1A.F.Ca.IN.020.32.1.1]RUW07498.1 hypothetical protein EOA46_23395 [Mesorhizobium sp. M1A.F.Ca.IN.022.05.2.1]RUW34573.1 hypothetical protein EOA60_05885 [Mesorhizobium sp. M1A.F.Ca.IN.020.06.1.1]RWF83254.1 MAG: hypothetical protein EOQ35_06895 [Mesorhizobium sp.]RWG06572.1 MAG: hypothetical protein EOQ38_01365 [Mesorhizobium sp.]
MTEQSNDKKDKEPKTVNIVVNDVARVVPKGKISFDQLVEIAFGSEANPADGYRISYDRGHGNASGKLKPGSSIEVVEGMDFTVTGTGQS